MMTNGSAGSDFYSIEVLDGAAVFTLARGCYLSSWHPL